MAGIIAKGQPTEAELVEWLATVPGYCQGTMESAKGEKLVFDGWQQEIIEDDSKINATLKARQIGFSYGPIAADALAQCQLEPKHLEIFTSANLDDAREKIRYARELHETIPSSFRHKLIIDNKFELEWANGSRIVTMFIPRGKGPGNVRLDEFAFIQDPREVLRGAFGVTTRGGRIVIGSTLKGNAGIPYEMLTGDTEVDQFKNIRRFRVYWWQSSALCVDVKAATRPVKVDGRVVMAAELLSTAERVERWASPDLKIIFSMMLLEDFQQEYELKPLEAEAAFIPWELIDQCANRNLKIYDSFEELKEAARGEMYAGVDIGRRKHTTELFIFERLEDKYFQRMLLTYREMPFEEQKFNLSEALRILPIAQMCIDETGIGMNLAEDLSNMYPHTVEPVNFGSRVEADFTTAEKKGTVGVKARMATDVKIAMERGNVGIYRDRDLMTQIYSIKREVSATGNVRYDAAKNEKHHGDKFWAMALALFGARQNKPALEAPLIVFPKIYG